MELLEQIEAYLVRTNTPPSKFGRMAWEIRVSLMTYALVGGQGGGRKRE